ncbi:hypothetical protein [Streptomyces sp. NPDC048508]|uniref:hypothetical protein n=1 Tax=Streptomyces sp. NPDC048508 TaxID=3365561 RepID=UPI003715B45A
MYRTIDVHKRPTKASELVALPNNGERDLRVVSWLHGTEVDRRAVASVNTESTDRATALLFASTGHALSAPDYLGLGKGPGTHPYGSAEGTVSAAAAQPCSRRCRRSCATSILPVKRAHDTGQPSRAYGAPLGAEQD